jgi:hypothetical protein
VLVTAGMRRLAADWRELTIRIYGKEHKDPGRGNVAPIATTI